MRAQFLKTMNKKRAESGTNTFFKMIILFDSGILRHLGKKSKIQSIVRNPS